jgi:D-3-phosphoglycerate dehydrogenase
VTPVADVATLARTSDLLSLHTEYSPALRHILDAQVLGQARRGLLLVNVARGGLIDEEALLPLLQDGTIGGVALDVFEKEPYQGPLARLQNVVLTPHIGAHAFEARVRMETEAVENIVNALGLSGPGVMNRAPT